VRVYVKTPARLHLGLIDMNGEMGRMFGGLGVAIDHPNVVVEAESAQGFSVTGSEAGLVEEIANRFFAVYKLAPAVHLNVLETLPPHVGLGSGTQLALAVATAMAKIVGIKASTQELALVMGRAKRTGVGTAVFEHGGFVVDGGKNQKTSAFPPLIFRQPFPKDWRFVVAVPNQKKGLCSQAESSAFKKMAPMPAEEAARICHLTMLKLLPALAERDIENFGDALTRIQVITGNYFAQTQGGTYANPATADLIEFMKRLGAPGVGQSSWGPAVYAVVKQEHARLIAQKVKAFPVDGGLGAEVFIAKANNKGATIKTFEV
jgi:beta-ribofuranosylaminobenzene 5'-phosphate synthase